MGFKDSKGRGDIPSRIVQYIERARPNAFILENVAGFLDAKYSVERERLLNRLRDIRKESGESGCYTLEHRILDARNHGVPQCRSRVFFTGVHNDFTVGDVGQIPEAPIPGLDLFLDPPVPSDDPKAQTRHRFSPLDTPTAQGENHKARRRSCNNTIRP